MTEDERDKLLQTERLVLDISEEEVYNGANSDVPSKK